MGKLQWDETEFIQALGVGYETPDDGEYLFTSEHDDFILKILLIDYRRTVTISIREKEREHPLIEVSLLVTGEVRFERNTFEFHNCQLVPDAHYWEATTENEIEPSRCNIKAELYFKSQVRLKLIPTG